MSVESLNGWSAAWAARMEAALWQGTLLLVMVWLACRLFPRLPATCRRLLWWLALVKPLLCMTPLPTLAAPMPRVAPELVAWIPAVGRTVPWARPIRLAGPEPGSSRVRPSEPTPSRRTRLPAAPHAPAVRTEPAGATLRIRGATRSRTRPLPLPSPASFFMLLWIGSAVAPFRRRLGEMREARRIRAGATLVTDPTILQAAARIGDAMGLSALPIIRESPRASGPLVLGVTAPTIVLPGGMNGKLSRAAVRMALAHEFGHIRRRDLWMGWVPGIAHALFFFHPLVRLGHSEWVAASESACDADSIRWAGVTPRQYGGFLLGLAASGVDLGGLAGWGASAAYRHLDRRLLLLATTRRPRTVLMKLGTPVLLLSLAALALPWSFRESQPASRMVPVGLKLRKPPAPVRRMGATTPVGVGTADSGAPTGSGQPTDTPAIGSSEGVPPLSPFMAFAPGGPAEPSPSSLAANGRGESGPSFGQHVPADRVPGSPGGTPGLGTGGEAPLHPATPITTGRDARLAGPSGVGPPSATGRPSVDRAGLHVVFDEENDVVTDLIQRDQPNRHLQWNCIRAIEGRTARLPDGSHAPGFLFRVDLSKPWSVQGMDMDLLRGALLPPDMALEVYDARDEGLERLVSLGVLSRASPERAMSFATMKDRESIGYFVVVRSVKGGTSRFLPPEHVIQREPMQHGWARIAFVGPSGDPFGVHFGSIDASVGDRYLE